MKIELSHADLNAALTAHMATLGFQNVDVDSTVSLQGKQRDIVVVTVEVTQKGQAKAVEPSAEITAEVAAPVADEPATTTAGDLF